MCAHACGKQPNQNEQKRKKAAQDTIKANYLNRGKNKSNPIQSISSHRQFISLFCFVFATQKHSLDQKGDCKKRAWPEPTECTLQCNNTD